MSLSNDVKEVKVIHGYHRGKELMNMVRYDLKNNKIERRFISLNPGVTSLMLSGCFQKKEGRI
jgi:hypothetical protein